MLNGARTRTIYGTARHTTKERKLILTSFTNLSYMNGHFRWFTTVSPFRSDTLVCPKDKRYLAYIADDLDISTQVSGTLSQNKVKVE